MRDFFKPWRRKLGVVTLGLACALAAAWVRSYDSSDKIWQQWTSSNGSIVWGEAYYRVWMVYKVLDSNGTERDVDFTFHRLTSVELDALIKSKKPSWGKSGFDTRETFLELPYWSIVTPLTVFSAYLLLSKPRPPAHKTTEPAPATGT